MEGEEIDNDNMNKDTDTKKQYDCEDKIRKIIKENQNKWSKARKSCNWK